MVDGDTLVVDIDGSDEVVRLLGIDTPEKSGSLRAAECFGDQATEIARTLVPTGTQIELRRDVESRDQYGRLLAHVFRDDGLHLNLEMLAAGAATPLFFSPNRALRDEFEAAAAAARKAWIGFWPTCGTADLVLQPAPVD